MVITRLNRPHRRQTGALSADLGVGSEEMLARAFGRASGTDDTSP